MGARKTSLPARRSAVTSGVLTGVSTGVVSLAAAVAGAVLAQKFGRDAETDGFLAAYGVYLALVIGAQAFRMVVVPDLTRAAAAGRLEEETGGYVTALLAAGLPLSAVAVLAQGPLGDALTGSLPDAAGVVAGDALAWLVPAAFAQLVAAVAASALAARDSYGIAAAAYAVGAVAGLALFLALADEHGLVALAWGVALNAAITLAIPLAFVRLRLGNRLLLSRLWALVQGAAPALAVQGMYLTAVRLAADLDVGDVTSFSYAYLIAASLVSVTASALSVVTAAPLTRRGLEGDEAARHVVDASWLSLVVVAGGAGFFALAGERVVSAVLGDSYGGEVGRDLGELVVWLAPWALAAIAFTLTLPLLFVVERHRRLVALSAAALALNGVLAWAGREAFGLPGIALALAVSTLVVLADMLGAVSRRTALVALAGLARAGAIVGGAAALAFGAASLAADGVPGALLGAAVYAALLGLVWRLGLRQSWAYVRGLR
jgi:O-antigen/teichoic acid export membrane protein